MNERYSRNIPAISEEEQEVLRGKCVLILGCGGLGGYNIEYMARLGVGKIIAVDGDSFCESNLNRQLYSNENNLGKSKALTAKEHVASINSNVEVIAVEEFFTADNADSLLALGADLVIDSLDNYKSRLLMEDACEKAGITIVHGAIQGWNLQAGIARPGQRLMHKLYGSWPEDGDESRRETDFEGKSEDPAEKTSLCFTPACCASIQAGLALQILTCGKSELDEKLFFMDMRTLSAQTVRMS